jgi:hypothetical protein
MRASQLWRSANRRGSRLDDNQTARPARAAPACRPSGAWATQPGRTATLGTHGGMIPCPRWQIGPRTRGAADDCLSRAPAAKLTSASARGRRVIAVPSDGFMTIPVARGGRLHCAHGAQAERREADVRRRAAAFVGHRAVGWPLCPQQRDCPDLDAANAGPPLGNRRSEGPECP